MIDGDVPVAALVVMEEDNTVGPPPVDERLLVNEGSAVGVELGTEVNVGAEGVGLGVEVGVAEDAVVDGSTGVDVLEVERTTAGGVLSGTFKAGGFTAGGVVDESGTFPTGVSLACGWAVVEYPL